MTLSQAKHLARTVQSLDREIGALELHALSKGWTADRGILVVQMAHRRLDCLEQIEDWLSEQERGTAALQRERETMSVIVDRLGEKR